MKSVNDDDFENSTGSRSRSYSIASLDKNNCDPKQNQLDCTNNNENMVAMDTIDDINTELKTTEKTNDIFQTECNTVDAIDGEKPSEFEEGIESFHFA